MTVSHANHFYLMKCLRVSQLNLCSFELIPGVSELVHPLMHISSHCLEGLLQVLDVVLVFLLLCQREGRVCEGIALEEGLDRFC
jgi:hypothetical protein